MKDKFICVDTDRVPGLTLHKIYDGFDTYPTSEYITIQVVDDTRRVKTYKRKRFMRLSEFRQNKLKELGI
jgi:hypothetical protein